MPDSHSQIAHLKTLLANLGMPSRPSMVEAKRIKERRELMQDVADVQDFEQKVVAPRARGIGQEVNENKSQSESSNSDDDSGRVKRPKVSVAKSIAAFLDDQSD